MATTYGEEAKPSRYTRSWRLGGLARSQGSSMALALPTALLSSQGDFVGWGLWGDLWGLFCLAPASVHEMYGKIMWGLSGTQLLSCTFLYSLQET